LRSELVALCTRPHRGWTAREVALLLREAFHTNVPVDDFTRVGRHDEWSDTATGGLDFINDLLANLDQLRQYAAPRPYWPLRRTDLTSAIPPRDSITGGEKFASLVRLLEACGYLDRDFGEPCAHGDPDHYAGGGKLAPVLEQRLGQPKLWPLQPEAWDEDIFYGLIEVFHDLVARPRYRFECDDCGGMHSQDFDTDAGRRVYRALVNRILDQDGIELRVAESGEDVGRLVHLADEARTDLVQRALVSPEPAVVGRVRHAIALFRRRDATEHHKRSAIVALHLVLEERRKLLKESLLRKDEAALFQIANEFDLRHGREQQSDYDPMFLDWVFWWYLATVELTDRLLTRQAGQTTKQTP
jgi:hypothetical protein